MLFCKTIGRTNGSLSIANGYHQKEDRESYFITTFNDPTNKATRNLSGVKQRGERFLVFYKHVKQLNGARTIVHPEQPSRLNIDVL